MACSLKAYRAGLLATAALLLIACAAIVYLALVAQRGFDLTAQTRPVCQTPECVALGASMSKSVNLSADPCQDFYEFACGNFGRHVHYKFQEDGVNLQGVNYVETMTAMRYEVLDRLHELLTVPMANTSADSDLDSVYTFAQSFYRECQAWWQKADTSDGDSVASSILFSNTLLERLLLSAVSNETDVWPELLLARIASTGVGGIFRVGVADSLVDSVLKEHQPNSPLRDQTRVYIAVNLSEALIWTRVHASALDHLASLAVRFSPQLVESLQPTRTVKQLASLALELSTDAGVLNGSSAEKPLTRRVSELKDDSTMGGFRWGVFFDELMSLSGAALDDASLVLLNDSQQTQALLNYLGQARRQEGDGYRRATIRALLKSARLRRGDPRRNEAESAGGARGLDHEEIRSAADCSAALRRGQPSCQMKFR